MILQPGSRLVWTDFRPVAPLGATILPAIQRSTSQPSCLNGDRIRDCQCAARGEPTTSEATHGLDPTPTRIFFLFVFIARSQTPSDGAFGSIPKAQAEREQNAARVLGDGDGHVPLPFLPSFPSVPAGANADREADGSFLRAEVRSHCRRAAPRGGLRGSDLLGLDPEIRSWRKGLDPWNPR